MISLVNLRAGHNSFCGGDQLRSVLVVRHLVDESHRCMSVVTSQCPLLKEKKYGNVWKGSMRESKTIRKESNECESAGEEMPHPQSVIVTLVRISYSRLC